MDHPLLVHVGQPVGDPLEDPQQLGHPLQRELVHRLAGDVLDEELGLPRAGEPPALDLQAVHLHQVRVVEHLAHAVLVLRLLQVLQGRGGIVGGVAERFVGGAQGVLVV